jgi:hypothetical protein
MISTQHGIEMYRMSVIHSAIKLYLKTGMKVNRMYTPANMVQQVTQKTGKVYKRGKAGMTEAFNDLEAWLINNRTLTEELPL